MSEIENKVLTCVAKCPELDCDNSKHCKVLEIEYKNIITERDYCPCGNREIMIEFKEEN